MVKKIYLWGAGNLGQSYAKSLKNNGMLIDGFIDSDTKKQGHQVEGMTVMSPDDIQQLNISGTDLFVYITSSFDEEIKKQLISMGFEERKHFISLWQFENDKYLISNFEDKLKEFLKERDALLSGHYNILSKYEDSFWFYLNTDSARAEFRLENVISPLPDNAIQVQLTGVSGDLSLNHGFRQYQVFKELVHRYGKPLQRDSKVLDFGSGYGRILRFFLREVDSRNLYGTDISEMLVNWSNENNLFGNFLLNNENPPLAFQGGSFDLIFSFSVFSHLSEESSQDWLVELSRVIKNDGTVILTIWAHPEITIEYHRDHYHDYDKLISEYEQGGYCYSNLKYRGSKTYGEALISLDYIRSEWSKYFEVVDIVKNHPNSMNQYYVVLRKRINL